MHGQQYIKKKLHYVGMWFAVVWNTDYILPGDFMIHLSLYVENRDIALNQGTHFPFHILSNSFYTLNQSNRCILMTY